MDKKWAQNNSSFSGPWTNEKHVHFLNLMEASFVHRMFENKGRLLRLDRYLPDISDSTLDLKTRRRKLHPTSADIIGPRTRKGSRADKRARAQSNQSYTSSHDQVVPQLGNRGSDKDEGDLSDATGN